MGVGAVWLPARVFKPKRRTPPHVQRDVEIVPCSQCLLCVDACPTSALAYRDRSWALDLSACTFCGDCADVCPNLLIVNRESEVLYKV